MYFTLILKQILCRSYIVYMIIIAFIACITESVIRNLKLMDYVIGTGKNKTVHDDNKSNDYKIWYYFGIVIVEIFSLTIWLHCFCRPCMEFIVRVTSNLYTNFHNLIQLLNLRTIICNLNPLNIFRAPPVEPVVPKDNLQVQFRDNMVALDPRALLQYGQYSTDEEV